MATMSLCLLSGCYRLAGDIVRAAAREELTPEILVECDKITQMIESPVMGRKTSFRKLKF